MFASDFEAAIGWGTRALELARDVDDPEVVINATENVGSALNDMGDEKVGVCSRSRFNMPARPTPRNRI